MLFLSIKIRRVSEQFSPIVLNTINYRQIASYFRLCRSTFLVNNFGIQRARGSFILHARFIHMCIFYCFINTHDGRLNAWFFVQTLCQFPYDVC